MTEVNPPSYVGGGCYTPLQDRRTLSTIVCEEGVAFGACPPGDLQVTDPGAFGLTVQVQPGAAFIQSDTPIACGGMYNVVNDSAVDLTPAPSSGTGDRTDLIIARVDSVAGTWALEIVQGADGSPAPVVPDDAIALAEVFIASGATEVQPTDIIDRRTPYVLCSDASSSAQTVVFTTGGTFNKADYPFARAFRVRAVGSGGAGGGSTGAAVGQSSAGGGGSGGTYAESILLPSALADSETVTVGVGGAGITDAAGANGETSSFGTHVVATGGLGGFRMLNSATPDSAGAAPVADPAGNTGDVVAGGESGGQALRLTATNITSGYGGSTVLGAGARGENDNGFGDPGIQYGGGGSGAATSEGPARAGGNGANGVVIVEVL